MLSLQFYSYALDKDKKYINIKDAIKGNAYYCPCCGAPMIIREGKIKRKHFAHKANTENCSYESYLHKLAKQKIGECFVNSPNFYITINSKAKCGIFECPIGKSNPCLWYKPYTFDLKKYYDTCEQEAPVGNFRADLLIISSNNHDTDPILIEIYVSHKSNLNKINSNYRIIEIKINSEEDIENAISYFKRNNNPEFQYKIEYHNFKPKIEPEFPHPDYQQSIFRFWIDDNKIFHFESPYDFINYKKNKCLSPINKEILDSIFKIESIHDFSLDFAFYKLYKSGLKLRYCTMCKNYYLDNSECGNIHSYNRLTQYISTDEIEILKRANNCSNFNQIEYFWDEEKSFKQYKCKITTKVQ